MSQRCTATDVTFRKAAFKLVPFAEKYPNKPLLSLSLSLNITTTAHLLVHLTFHTKKNTLPTSITGITKTLALWLQQLTSAEDLRGVLSLSRRPPYFHHAILAADIRYPVSIAIQLPQLWSPAASVVGSIHLKHPNVGIAMMLWCCSHLIHHPSRPITSGVADCTFTMGGGHGAYGLTAENHHGRSTPSSFWWTTSPSAYAWSLQTSSAKLTCLGGTTASRGNQPTAAARVKLLWRKGTIHHHLQEGNLEAIPLQTTPSRAPQNPGESCRKQLLGRYFVGIAVGQTSQSPQASISKRKACKRLSLQTWSAKFS